MFNLTRKFAISLTASKVAQPNRQFWWWLTIISNRMDSERCRTLGYDRCTAEWLLRNGSCVKFVNSPEPLCDYNLLPPENMKFFVEAIIADNAGINDDGFMHIKGCTKLDKISLKNCSNIEDGAMKTLHLRKDTLKHLELIDCKNLTDEGLRSLKGLNLKTLVIRNVPYVKHFEDVERELRESLKDCDITMEK